LIGGGGKNFTIETPATFVGSWMRKKGDTTRRWTKASIKKRFFVLIGSTLRYFKSRDDIVSGKKEKGTINLAQVGWIHV
jgi:hypothetical protein